MSLNFAAETRPATSLVFAWGNPSRGDDAIGPLFIETLSGDAPTDTDFLCEYQLQVEHSLDLVGRKRVLFVDASVSCIAPFELTPVRAARDQSFTSHAMSPHALLEAYQMSRGEPAPPACLLSIRGYRFELGLAPSEQARQNLDHALAFARHRLLGKSNRDWELNCRLTPV